MLEKILPYLFGSGAVGALVLVALFFVRRSAQKEKALNDSERILEEIYESNKEAAQNAQDISDMSYDDVVDGLQGKGR